MTSLHPASAAGARPHRDVEAGQHRGRLGKVLHELQGRAQDDQLATVAIRTRRGKCGRKHAVRLPHGQRPTSPGAIVVAALATGLLRVGLADSLGERRRLALAATADLFDELLQLGDAIRLQLDKLAELDVLRRQLVDRASFAVGGNVVSRNSQRSRAVNEGGGPR